MGMTGFEVNNKKKVIEAIENIITELNKTESTDIINGKPLVKFSNIRKSNIIRIYNVILTQILSDKGNDLTTLKIPHLFHC